MVDYAPPWDAHPRDTLHASHDVPVEQVRRSALTLATLLDEKKEEQVLKEACLGLCQLFGEGIQNDRIQAILEADVVPKLVHLLRPSRSRSVPISVQLAALQVLGNVACGDDQQTQVVIDSDALPCLRALLFSSDRQIRKEVCWIVSNITESSHQVQDVLDADILPPLLKLLDNQDGACREDATWVLFNLSSNRVPKQIAYLAENDGIRALCNLLTCQKELDVLWKGCGTVAAVALKGLRNVLISGQIVAASNPDGHNEMAALVAEAHGVERIEALTTHNSPDVRNRARLILERIFGTEPSTLESLQSFPFLSPATHARSSQASPRSPPVEEHIRCSCGIPQSQSRNHKGQSANHYHHAQGVYGLNQENSSSGSSIPTNSHVSHGITSHCMGDVQSGAEVIDSHASTSGSSTDSDPDDDDSDSDLIPPPPAPCSCLLCTDLSPLAERRPRGKGSAWDDPEFYRRGTVRGAVTTRSICSFCSGGGRLGDGRAGLAAKLGRAVRLGHPHCLAIILSRMTWSQRIAATEAPALLHPGGGPPDGGVGSSLPAVILSAQLGKPLCLSLLLKRCQPNLDLTYGKKRLTALAWASHKGYLRCCQLLLEHGANPATVCGEAVTALHLAASGGGHVTICKLLLDHLAPVNSRSAKKQTPLCLAAQKGYSKIVQILLDAGADPNNQDEGKYTPLHLAASNGHLQTVNILLSHGAVVDATTRNEVTPLHYAVQGGHSQVVQALICSGAKVNCSKKPLLLIAADDGKLDIVNLLLNADASIDCRANIRAVLDKETDVCDYLTPLHLAASKNHHEVVDALIRRGADVNELTSKSGWSALDFSVLNGHSESAIILLQHGAIVTDTCKSIGRNNWTLVQYAASNGAKDVVRLLIQRIKEQRACIPASVNVSSAPLTRPSASESGTTRPLVETLGSGGLMKNPYSVQENIQTCSACSKLRQSSCISQPNHTIYSNTKAGITDQDIHDTKKERVEGFSSSSLYDDICSPETKAKHHFSRRKVVRDDRQSTLRAREIRKRESEAREARGRLEEAISQRSVTKLTEAISHVSKLVLHLAASVGCDGPNSPPEHTDASEHDTFNGAYSHSGQAQPSRQKYGSNPSNSSLISAPLAMEVGLGNEVQKARKILASLLAEEKRVREEKEKEAMDSKRENAQQIVKKAIGSVLDGGDPRSLSRAVNRATKTILDTDNPIVVEATRISALLSGLEKHEQVMRNAIDSEDLESLKESLSELKKHTSTLNGIGGTGATQRIFRGREPKEVIATAENVLSRFREKRQREEAEQLEAMIQERMVNEELQEAMKLDDISQLENTINRACKVLVSKQSTLANTIEAAKKLRARRLKIERRKLRQASNTNDPLKIEEAASIAEMFGLNALRHDVEAAKAHAQRLREQAAAAEDLKHAISHADVNVLTVLRSKLNSLGMFSEAETARSEIERLQRAIRAGTLLETAVQESRALYDQMKFLLAESRTVDEIMTDVSTWTWPDIERLSYLSERARQHGSLHNSICQSADILVKELVSVGQRLLEICLESNDARAIAATITRFDRTFTAVIRDKEIDCKDCEKAVALAKQHLAHIQAMDQASVKAESAQVKVEYALATSRRSAARNRLVKGSVVPRFGGHVLSGNSIKSELNEALLISNSRVCSSRASTVLVEDDGFESGTVCKDEDSQRPRSTGEHVATPLKRPSVRAQAREDSVLHESFEASVAAPGGCSHFYLFKEGNTVCCTRCGNHRSSSNPEWLARVKKRGSSIQQDTISEWPEPQDILDREDDQTDLRKVYSSNRSTTLDASGVGSSLNQDYEKARMENMPLVHASPQDFPRSRISSRETSRSTPMSSHAKDVNIMIHMLQKQTEIQPVPSGASHRFRGTGQQIPPSSIMHRTPSMFHVDMTTCPQVSSGIRASGSEAITSFNHTRIPSIAPHLRGEHGAADSYGVSDDILILNTRASETSNGMSSPLGRQRLQMERIVVAHSDTGQSSDIGVGLQINSNSISEDMAEVGRDLCTDFANENFGFDIDAIVDEPAPLGRI